MRLAPDQAGSVERPYYRQEGQAFPDLLARLRHHLPTGRIVPSPRARVENARTDAYVQRVEAALNNTAPDPLVQVPLRQGELTALLHLLEYIESQKNPFGRLLAADIKARTGRSPSAEQVEDSALQEAARRRRRREQRRGPDDPA
ncbi:hypothetical protein JK359_33300 [Streptomyces actinomycinicus]|uniref:Uncharacterized protein n=1 Tax=Streptomyces actinomycinicus TaxID=1695166 RepID=A0A937JPF9_9ACTN|nr:hypothetical protein [Streptomyces actinomycinicus]MBL1086784.1 hypothetical protein [Streptomyces actinomycinicus]